MSDSTVDPSERPILFAGLPESGLLNPLLVLAGELARRGVPDLWFATDEHRRKDVVRLAATSVVGFESLGEVASELSAVTWDDKVYRQVTQKSRFKAFRATMRQSHKPFVQMAKRAALNAVVERVRPALMVIDCMCFYAIDVAISRGIPYVLSVPFVASNVLTSHIPFGRSWTPPGFPVPSSGLPARMTPRQRTANRMFKLRGLLLAFDPVLGKAFQQEAKLRKAAGLPRITEMTRIQNAELVLCNSIADLDYPFAIPETMILVGTMVPPLPEVSDRSPVDEWLDAQNSVVYLGFGTITRLTAAEVAVLVEVARRLEGRHEVLWKLPTEQQHLLSEAGPLPRNLRIESWVPSQLDILNHEKVKAFFTHGGGNAYHEGVYFGKPQVIRPLWVDCFDQAVRAQDLGIGLSLDDPWTITVDDVLDKLTRVLQDPSFVVRARGLGRQLRAAGGRQTAADLILGLPALAGVGSRQAQRPPEAAAPTVARKS
ncbi:MAG: polyene glycosyltransferase [Actinoplanes sp.]|nr:polyene glycosyltransferase [Actinoplanes sp.]